jgi:hypothetical protein
MLPRRQRRCTRDRQPETVARLVVEMESQLPTPAFPTKDVVRTLRRRGVQASTDRALSVKRVLHAYSIELSLETIIGSGIPVVPFWATLNRFAGCWTALTASTLAQVAREVETRHGLAGERGHRMSPRTLRRRRAAGTLCMMLHRSIRKLRGRNARRTQRCTQSGLECSARSRRVFRHGARKKLTRPKQILRRGQSRTGRTGHAPRRMGSPMRRRADTPKAFPGSATRLIRDRV